MLIQRQWIMMSVQSGTSAVQSEASAGVSSAAENVSHRTREELSDEGRMPSDNTAGSLDQVLSTLVPQLLQQNSAQVTRLMVFQVDISIVT